jgi:thioester reductase-like protein
MPIFYNCTVATGPPEKPPSGELLSQAMKKLNIRAAWCPPTVIEQLVDLPGGFEQAASLDWIMYTGGPLAPAVGDRLSKVTDVCQMYGSTETGPHVSLVPLPENWNYFEWHPLLENKMESMGDGTFEMVVEKDPSLDWIRHLSQAYPNLEVWRTNDLFVQNPNNSKLWRFTGRRDDVLVLSNGEKFNPVNMEGVITGHPLVRGALVVGTARFQASLIVEPDPEVKMPADQFIDEIWPTIEQANKVGPAHGRIFRSKVTVATPDKPFMRAGKGTVIRGKTTQLYSDEINKLYEELGIENNKLKLEDLSSLQSVTSFVRECVRGLFSLASFENSDDLFVLGMDSLQTLELVKILQRALKGLPGGFSAGLSIIAANIYANPTIERLANFIYTGLTISEPTNLEANLTRAEIMSHLVEKYSTNFPGRVTAGRVASAKSDRPVCIAITGTTGSLGTHMLEAFLCDNYVARIFCLNRRQDARTHNLNALKYVPNIDSLLAKKATFLTIKLGKAQFGLADNDYEELRQHVDVIIHNAWKVNFNHQLASFEDAHIRGVRDFIDFSLTSKREPHILFVSSISSVGNWASACGPNNPITEEPLTDYNVAMELGYAESKHVSERILSNATTSSGLNASILRVGQVAGPLARNKGDWNRTEWMPNLIKTSKALGCLPDTMNTIDWMPVDRLAQIIKDILHSSCREGSSKVFNLVNPHEGEWKDLVPAIQKHWQPSTTKIVPFSEWLQKLQALENPDLEKYPAIKILDFYKGLAKEAGQPRIERISYRTDNCIASSASMASLQEINAGAVTTWLEQWQF